MYLLYVYITTRIYRIFPTPVYRVQLCHPYSSHVNFNHFRIFFVCVAFWIFFPNSSPRKPPRSLIRGTYYYISVLLRFFILFILFLSSKMCVCYMLNMVILSPSPLSSSVCGVSRGKLGREDMSRINKNGTFFFCCLDSMNTTLSPYIFKKYIFSTCSV